jgi:hypothetical protein
VTASADREPDVGPLLEALQDLRRRLDRGVDERLCVRFDERSVRLWRRVPGGGRVLRAAFAWGDVSRVCFKDNGPLASDLLFVSTRRSRGAVIVPLEADGGGALWRQLPARGLFPAWLHERATLSMDGGFHCWPPAPGRGRSLPPGRREPGVAGP